ncbi:unnamed protein product [Rhizopus stolonifer]
MGLRVLSIFKPFMAALPEIESPDRRIPFNERIVYTGVALLAYLVMSQLPLYGIQSSIPLIHLIHCVLLWHLVEVLLQN